MAHKLARRAITNPLDVWMESVSPDTNDVYSFDLRFINQWHSPMIGVSQKKKKKKLVA